MQIKISDLRLSWIWTEVFPDLLLNNSEIVSRFTGLGTQDGYSNTHEKAKKREDGLSLPWTTLKEKRCPQFFWQYYLENRDPKEITAKEAWRKLVPIREALRWTTEAAWLPGQLRLECFHYPHGLALAVTVRIAKELLLDAMLQKAIEVSSHGQFDVEWSGFVRQLSLSALASEALNHFRKQTFGPQTKQGLRSSKPFTVATVIQGTNVDKNAWVQENGAIHRALYALCHWDKGYDSVQLPSLDDNQLGIRAHPAGHVLYRSRTGRTVWFPDAFLPRPFEKKTSMSCYHRNLTFASIQTESLARLMVLARDHLISNTTLLPSMETVIKSAAGILGRMYGRDPTTYCSSSPAAQLEDNGWVVPTNYIRNYYLPNAKPLHQE